MPSRSRESSLKTEVCGVCQVVFSVGPRIELNQFIPLQKASLGVSGQLGGEPEVNDFKDNVYVAEARLNTPAAVNASAPAASAASVQLLSK